MSDFSFVRNLVGITNNRTGTIFDPDVLNRNGGSPRDFNSVNRNNLLSRNPYAEDSVDTPDERKFDRSQSKRDIKRTNAERSANEIGIDNEELGALNNIDVTREVNQVSSGSQEIEELALQNALLNYENAQLEILLAENKIDNRTREGNEGLGSQGAQIELEERNLLVAREAEARALEEVVNMLDGNFEGIDDDELEEESEELLEKNLELQLALIQEDIQHLNQLKNGNGINNENSFISFKPGEIDLNEDSLYHADLDLELTKVDEGDNPNLFMDQDGNQYELEGEIIKGGRRIVSPHKQPRFYLLDENGERVKHSGSASNYNEAELDNTITERQDDLNSLLEKGTANTGELSDELNQALVSSAEAEVLSLNSRIDLYQIELNALKSEGNENPDFETRKTNIEANISLTETARDKALAEFQDLGTN